MMLVKMSVNVNLFTHMDFHGSRSSPAQSQDQEGDGGKGGLHVNTSQPFSRWRTCLSLSLQLDVRFISIHIRLLFKSACTFVVT